MRQAGDASVEEILESIKKVIAWDNRAGSAEQRRQRETRGVPAASDEAPARADSRAERPAPAPAPRPAEPDLDDVLDLAVSAQFLDDEDDDAQETADYGEDSPASLLDSHLVTDEARSAMRHSLAALAMMAEPRAAPQIVRSGETSLEGLVREMLRPMLAEWLDKNLPPMVERLVAAEIAKIVGKTR